MLSSTKFDAAIGVVILINSVLIGVQTEAELDKQVGLVQTLVIIDNIFLGIYTVEISSRFIAYGTRCLDNRWVRFDAILVGFGIITTILEVLVGASKEQLGPFMVLRVLRLLRLARAVRLFSQFKPLWMLVNGLLSSAGTMAYTFVLMILILFLFANMAIELITKDEELRSKNEEFDALVKLYFPDLFTTMMTLVQFVTLDDIGAIYRPMVPLKRAELVIFFGLFLLVVSISLMNLVTAVIVEGSLDQANADKEVNNAYKKAKMRELIPTIRHLFKEMDADGDGLCDLHEVLTAPPEIQQELGKVMGTDNLVELFEILDIDGSGSLDLDEFVDGISKLVCNDQPMDQIRMQKNMNILRNDMKDVLYYVKEVADDIREEVRNGFVRQAQGLPPLEPERLMKPPPKRSCRSYLIDQDGNVSPRRAQRDSSAWPSISSGGVPPKGGLGSHEFA